MRSVEVGDRGDDLFVSLLEREDDGLVVGAGVASDDLGDLRLGEGLGGVNSLAWVVELVGVENCDET